MKSRGRAVLITALLAVGIALGLKYGLAPSAKEVATLNSSIDESQTAADVPAAAPAAAGASAASGSSAAAVAQAKPAESAATLQIHTAEEFAKLTEEVLHSLPQLKALQGLDGEAVHNTPDIIREAGAALGQVAQVVSDNSSFEEPAVHFYNECTLQAGGINSIRALCFANLKRLSAKLKLPLDEEKYPADVRRLAVHILD